MRINTQNLRIAMVKAEMTNKTLSEKAGISATQISNIRQGKRSTYDTAVKLAKALSVPVAELIEEE